MPQAMAMSSLTRRLVLSAAAAGLFSFGADAAVAGHDPAAETFIQGLAEQAVTILDNKQLTQSEREDEFSELVLANTDIEAIGNFALGVYRRSATPAELAEYHDLFRRYSQMFYSTRLSR
jgi:phospholipid transport system substrate-binding protein